MARSINKLTDRRVKALTEGGHYSDGGGLWLQISNSGTKSWVFRFKVAGKQREMGLGPLHTVSLAEARLAALQARKLIREGLDPIETRKSAKAAARAADARQMTFKECAEAYMAAHRASWRNAKHASQWANTLGAYAYPTIGSLPVDAVTTDLVVRCLADLWTTKTETATRVRGRIEAVLDWATTAGYRSGLNPARWKGHLENLLASPTRVAKVEHHPALPYPDVFAFMQQLRALAGVSALALEFAILTAARTGEVIGARWEEFDLQAAVWTIPGDRMKTGREHRVPLSRRAVEILASMGKPVPTAYVFAGGKPGTHLSSMALLMTLRRMKRRDLTTHGFRSTFRDWAAELTAYPREVAEMALAHIVENRVEAAYRRGDLFAKRARMMEEWATYCATPPAVADVVPIRGQRQAAEVGHE